MSNSKIIIASSIGLLCPLLFPSPSFGVPLSMSKQIAHYTGSGTIRNTSIFLSPGYRIEFPSFDPKLPYSASYQVANIPQTSISKGALIWLLFVPSQTNWFAENQKKNVTASFRFTILNTAGEVLKSADLALANSIWTDQDFPLVGIYHHPKSFFVFESATSYVVKVQYSPGLRPPLTKEMHFAIEKGGHL